jgi:hypothetical protein
MRADAQCPHQLPGPVADDRLSSDQDPLLQDFLSPSRGENCTGNLLLHGFPYLKLSRLLAERLLKDDLNHPGLHLTRLVVSSILDLLA